MGEIGIAMEVLTRVDFDLAYSSKKIANLDKLLVHVMVCENDLKAFSLVNEGDSVDLVQKLFVFDLLSGILESEVRELANFMSSLQEVITDARSKISGFRNSTDLFEEIEAKLHDSDDLLQQSREQLLEIGLQSTKLTKPSFDFSQNDCSYDKGTVEQKRHILRMLEKNLNRELDLEKKLSEFKQNEEDLKLKQRLTEQLAFAMEEAAEAVWGRFLEADNAKEVLLGTSKEMLKQFQIIKLNLNGSLQREYETKLKLNSCTEQLKAREDNLQKLENGISELISDNLEVCSLREKVIMLEKQSEESDAQLKSANILIDVKEENILKMENIIESLKENIDLAENRADSARAKITELTETNLELNEELSFLKSSNDSNAKKVSAFEKQFRDLEIQLQYSRATSEASQEQQNMLYSAIWDMETLVEELKSKVSKAETKSENAEEQCTMLSETNIELEKEVRFLKSKLTNLIMYIEQVKGEKVASARDVNVKTKTIMDMVVQLALERERIQKQMFGLVEENKVLVEKLQKSERGASANEKDRGSEIGASLSLKTAIGEVTSKIYQQVDESSKDNDLCETEPGTSRSPDDNSNIVSEQDSGIAINDEGHNWIYVYISIIVLLFSILALYFFTKETNISDDGR